jgi:hypothetical protein
VNPFGTRGAADDLARLLDAGTTTGSSAAALAGRLRSVGHDLDAAVAPRAEFRDALRMRLMAVATVQASAPVAVAAPLASAVTGAAAPARSPRGDGLRRAVSGVAVAGSQSLPGDPFYGRQEDG